MSICRRFTVALFLRGIYILPFLYLAVFALITDPFISMTTVYYNSHMGINATKKERKKRNKTTCRAKESFNIGNKKEKG